jgi:hypothetical protein
MNACAKKCVTTVCGCAASRAHAIAHAMRMMNGNLARVNGDFARASGNMWKISADYSAATQNEW